MKHATIFYHSYIPAQVKRVLPALAADVGILAVFLYVALGSSSSAGSPVAAIDPLQGQPDPPRAVSSVAGPTLGSVKAQIGSRLENEETRVGVVLRDEAGDVMLEIDSDQRFVLASVAKVYIMAAYLDMLWNEGTELDESDEVLLEDMIRYSDNDSASVLWRRIGSEEGLDAFLRAHALPPMDLIEDEAAWGTMNATAGEVSEFLWRLVDGDLLDVRSTALALDLLGNVFPEQAWGVSAGVAAPGSSVMLKNGWYPEANGWRVNSAGVIESSGSFYVLVILAYPTPGLEEGIALLEGIASQVNAYMTD